MSGRGTAGGVVFQAEVGAYIAGLILSQRPFSYLSSGLPGKPLKIYFEAPIPIDDISVQTDCGKIYIQAKRTVSLSDRENTELASVANQFVRQFRKGYVDNGYQRDLSPFKDRLILAVSAETNAPITRDLKEALDRNRTESATGIPQKIVRALNTFAALIKSEWFAETNTILNDEDLQKVLSVCSIVVINDTLGPLTQECLREVVAASGDEIKLIELLHIWAAKASEKGVGGDIKTIRLALNGKIKLAEPPFFRNDTYSLITYSTKVIQKLKQFTEIIVPEGSFIIVRPVVDSIVDTIRHGSLLITGEPGAGKSAVLYQVAQQLKEKEVIIVFTVEASITSYEIFRNEIGLEHSLLEVLEQISESRSSYLILDALDAVRGGTAEAFYRRLIEDVLLLPNWTVIASVRSFDLRLGRHWHQLFKGLPPHIEHSEASFNFVRHVHVKSLSIVEQESLFEKSPKLAKAVEAGGAKIKNLVNNPFNLAMLGELLSTGVNPDSFSTITTRGDILERYWEARMAEFGTSAVVSLKVLTSAMIASRTIDLPETSIPVDATSTIDNLLRVGVLVKSGFKIGFRHHILFDYAVARLILLPNRDEAKKYLNRELGLGLLIAPAIGYWLEHLKTTTLQSEYWEFIVTLINDSAIDPLVIVESARLAIESVKEDENLDVLVKIFSQEKSIHKIAFNHLTGAIITKCQSKQPVTTNPWAHFLAKLKHPKSELLGCIHSLMSELLAKNNTTDVINSLGTAARNFFDILSKNENLIPWLSRHYIKFITQTYGTDPEASHLQLKKIFEPERFSRFGHIEVPEFAENVMDVISYDEDLVIQSYYYVFKGGKFSHEQGTSGGGWIFSFSSNAAQDFRLAEHYLSKVFPDLINKFPRAGIQALSMTLLGKYEKAYISYEYETTFITLGNISRAFKPDLSHIWARNIDDDQHDDYAKIYQAVISWAKTINDLSILEEIPDLLLNGSGIAITWRTLFDIAIVNPSTLGKAVWSVAATPPMFQSPDTIQSSINLIAAVYPLIEDTSRKKAEIEWLNYNFSEYRAPFTTRNNILGTLFERIGETHLISGEAILFLSDLKNSSITFESKENYLIPPIDNHSIKYEDGIKKRINPSLNLCFEVKEFLSLLKQDISSEDLILNLWNRICSLEKWFVETKKDISEDATLVVLDTLAEAYGFVLYQKGLSDEQASKALTRLIELTYHNYLQISENTEEFSLSYSPPFPRLQAADGLTFIIKKPEFWPRIQIRFQEMLFQDAHPIIRSNLMQSLPWLNYIDNSLMWNFAEEFLLNEKNSQLIPFSGRLLSVLLRQNGSRLEELILALYKQAKFPPRRDDIITKYIVYFAIVKGLSNSETIISEWVTNYFKHESQLQSVLFEIRNRIIIGIESNDGCKEKIRERTKAFLWALIKELQPTIQLWPKDNTTYPTEEQRAALKLFESIGDQIYCAVGLDSLSEDLATTESQQKFLFEYSEMISVLTSFGTPKTIYHLFKFLKHLIDANPEHCFDLFSEALLRTSGIGRYEQEWIGAELFVEIVSRYLADYRSIFTDQGRQIKLIGCLSLFVDSGWPEARKLFQHLPELLS